MAPATTNVPSGKNSSAGKRSNSLSCRAGSGLDRGMTKFTYKSKKDSPIDTKELLEDKDNLSMEIFRMYQHKFYLPHNQRVSNMAWRIQNRKIMQNANKREAEGSRRAVSLLKMDTSDPDLDEFDYVAHIRKISEAEVSRDPNHMDMESMNVTSPESNRNSISSSSSLFSSRKREPSVSIYQQAQQQANTINSHKENKNFLSSYIDSLESTLMENYSMSSEQPKITTPEAPKHFLQCSNCRTKTTPLWRKSKTGSFLCNACGLFYKLHGTLRPMGNDRLKNSSSPGQGDSKTLIVNSEPFQDLSGSPKLSDFAISPNVLSHHHHHLGLQENAPAISRNVDIDNDFYGTRTNFTSNDIDEIDNILNMNFLQSNSFAAGSENVNDMNLNMSKNEGDFAIRIPEELLMGVSDEILNEQQMNEINTTWHWLDLAPSTTD